MEKIDYITVGEISGPFGVKGLVKVNPMTDFPERFLDTEYLFLLHRGELQKRRISGVRLQPGRVIMRIEGIDTAELARLFQGDLLQVPLAEAWPLPEGSYYHFQIVGLTVETEDGEVLGKVSEVISTGSNDVYRVESPEGKSYLIPALKQVVPTIDLESGKMIIRPLPGMLE